jgi:uncharacterized protein GlcG (DUF336 family)
VTTLGVAAASLIVVTAVAEGRRLDLAPLAVAVLDAGGNLKLFAREDGAGILRFDIAFAKAWGSLGMGFGTRELADRATRNPAFVTALAAVSGGRVAPSPGGVLIGTADGEVIGAVGISGDLGDRDEACALAGIRAAGLVAHPGVPGS